MRTWRTEKWDLTGGSAQVRNIRDPGQPTVKEHQEHMTTHRPHRSWCKFCVMARGVNASHRRSGAQEALEGVPHMSMDCGFLGRRESEEQESLVLVIRERRHKMTWAMLVPRKGNGVSLDRKGSSEIRRSASQPRSDATTSQRLKRWQGTSDKLAKKVARLCQTVPYCFRETTSGEKPVQWHRTSCGARCRPGQDTEGCVGASHRNQSPARRKDIVLAGGICSVLDEQVRHRQPRKDGTAEAAWPKGQHTHSGIRRDDPAHAGQASEIVESWNRDSILECLWIC